MAMALTSRERLISYGLMAVGALFIIDRLALDPFLERHDELTKQLQVKTTRLADANHTIHRAHELKRQLANLDKSVTDDSSAAENQVLHLVRDFEQQAGLGQASFQRNHTVEEHGFTHLSFHVSATGSLKAVALLMHRVETAGIPLRLDEVHVAPRSENGDSLQVQLNLSTLCRATAPATPRPGTSLGGRSVAAVGFAGDRR
jgi:Tfp pilus assembly protein PilO